MFGDWIYSIPWIHLVAFTHSIGSDISQTLFHSSVEISVSDGEG